MQALTQCADAAAAAPRLPVHRHARHRQDHGLAHPRQEPELHRPRRQRRHHRPALRRCARPAPRSMPTATSTTSSSTPRRNRGIDEMRDCSSARPTSRASGRFKVFMIDEAHQLTKDAFNALLKTLEEPPEYLKFVLATTDPREDAAHGAEPLPAVQPAADGAARWCASTLQACCRTKASRATPARCACSSRAARGSMRDALSLTDQAIAYGGGALVEERGARRCSGTVDRGHAVRLVQRARRSAMARAVIAAVDELRGSACRPPARWRKWPRCCSRWRCEQAVPGALDADDPDAAQAAAAGAAAAGRRDAAALQHRAARSRRADSGARRVRGADDGAAATSGVSDAGQRRWHAAQRAPRACSRRSGRTALRRAAVTTARRTIASRPHATEPPPWVDDADEAPRDRARSRGAARPPRRRAAIQRHSAIAGCSAGGAAGRARPVVSRWCASWRCKSHCVGGRWRTRWTLRVERESLRAHPLRDKLQAAPVAALLGRAVTLEVERGTPTTRRRCATPPNASGGSARPSRLIHDDPLVRELMSQFKTARIVPGSIKPH